jgi:hypothetical protein
MKFRFYRKWRAGGTKVQSWEYLCSTSEYPSKEEAMHAFLERMPFFRGVEIRCEDASVFGYYIED